MRTRNLTILAILLCTAAAFPAAGLFSGQIDLKQFDWLTGSWRGTDGGNTIVESWARVDASTLEGMGYFIVGKDTVVTELMRIQQFGDHWAFVAVINGGHPVLFTLIESGDGRLVFENTEHDFPQRVAYNRVGKDSILAWIEGEQDGETMRQEFPMKREG